MSAGNIISQILNFIAIVYLTRKLSVTDFSKITYAQNIMLYMMLFSNFGLLGYGNREIAKGYDRRTVSDITSLRLIISIIANVLLFIVLKGVLIEKDLITIIMIYSVSTIIGCFDFSWVFNGLQLMQQTAIQNIVKSVVYLIIIVLFTSTIYNVSLAFTVSFLVSVLYLINVYFRKGYKFNLRVLTKTESIAYIGISFYFFLQLIFTTINSNIDIMLMGVFRPINEVGIYSVGYKIINILVMIVSFIMGPIYPILIKLYSDKDYKQLNSIIEKMYKAIILVMMPITFGGIVLSKQIIGFVFGSKYEGAYLPFSILLVYLLLMSIRETYGYCLNAWYKHKEYTKVIFISSSVNLVLNLVIIPLFGYKLAALSTLFSEIINVTLFRLIYNRLKIAEKRDGLFVTKVVMCSIIMMISVIGVNAFYKNLILDIGIGILVYALIVHIFGLMDIKLLIKKISFKGN